MIEEKIDVERIFRFPKDFLWGASTASYQVEGGIENCDWALAARVGKVPVSGKACDHYNRFERDFDIVKELGHNCHRLSIEWARIEPEEGVFDEREVEHYRKVLQALRARDIKPLVTIWHFTLPQWFSESGGFLRSDSAAVFARYARHIITHLGPEANIWITLNEPIVYAAGGYAVGICPPFTKNPIRFWKVLSSLARAHRAAFDAMKDVRRDVQIGVAQQNIYFESNLNPINQILFRCADWFWNHRFLRAISAHQDFIGLNQYHHYKFGMSAEEKRTAVPTGFSCDMHTESLYHCLVSLKTYAVPIYVTENGVADDTDTRRVSYIQTAVKCVHRALQEGVPIKGYCHWTLMDNYEWLSGFTCRMGLVAVDFETQDRRIRPSAYVYKEIIEKNALID